MIVMAFQYDFNNYDGLHFGNILTKNLKCPLLVVSQKNIEKVEI